MSGAEAPSSGSEQANPALEAFQAQEVNKLSNQEQKTQLKTVIEAMEKAKTPANEIITLLQPVVDSLKIAEGYPADKKTEMDQKWANAIQDGQVSTQEVREMVNFRAIVSKTELNNEIVDGLTKDSFIYLKRRDGVTRVEKESVSNEFKIDDHYTIDFGVGEAGVDQAKALAQQRITRLDHMLPATVNRVQVESLKYGKTVSLIRYPDGKFREAGSKPTDKHFYIFQGDKVTVLERADSEAPEELLTAVPEEMTHEEREAKAITDIKEQREALQAEARERTAEANEGFAEEQANYFKKAMGEINGPLEALKRGVSASFPESLHLATRKDYEENLASMEYGDQVLGSLVSLDGIQNNEGWARLMEKLMDGDIIRYQELTRTVLNKTPKQVADEHAELARDIKVIDFASGVIDREVGKLMKGELTQFKLNGQGQLSPEDQKLFMGHLVKTVKKEMLASNSFAGEDVTRFYLYIEELTPTSLVTPSKQTENLEALRTRMENLRKFYIESYKLMEALPKMKLIEAGDVKHESYSKDSTTVQVEAVTRLFFNPDDKTPAVKKSVFDRLFRPDRTTDNLTMSNGDIGVNAEDADTMERTISSSAAYEIVRDASTHFEGPKEMGDLKQLAAHLEQLRHDGWSFSYPKSDYTLAPIDEATVKAWASGDSVPTEQDRELISIGMMREQRDAQLAQKRDLTALETARKAEVISDYPQAIQEMLTQLDAKGKFTADELNEMGRNIKECDLGMLGFLMEQERTIDHNLPRSEAETVERTLGVGYNKSFTVLDTGETKVSLSLGARDNIITHDFSIHAGLGTQTQVRDRTHLGTGLGASVGENGVNVGASVSFGVDLGEYRTMQLGVQTGVGFSKTFGAAFLGISLERDLEAVAGKKAEQLMEERETEMKRGIEDYLNTHADEMKYFTDAQRQEIVDDLVDQYKNDIEGDAVEAMKWLQFKGIGVVFIPLPGGTVIPVPWIRLGFKGKEFLHYTTPKDMPPLDAVAEARLTQELAKRTEVPLTRMHTIAVSGRLQMTEKNDQVQKTITAGDRYTMNLDQARLDLINAGLLSEGLEVQQDGERLKLRVKNVDGILKIYTDPKAGYKTYTEGGYTYIDLKPGQALSMQRVDTYYPLPYFGYTHHTSVYLSNNPYVSNRAIEQSSSDHIQWEQSDRAETQKEARVVQHSTATERTSTSVEGAGNIEGEGKGFFMSTEEKAEQQTAYEHMRRALNQNPETQEFSDARKAELKALAQTVIKTKSIDYAKLTTDEVYFGQVVDAIRKQNASPLNNVELTFVLQEIMVRSRPETSDEKFPEHIANWNRIALQNALRTQGVPEQKAIDIAKKVMAKYTSILLERMARNEECTRTPIKGDLVHTQIGPRATGNIMEFVTQGENIALLGAQAMTVKNLEATFGLTPEEATLLINAKRKEMAPMSAEKPSELLHSPVGLGVLNLSDLIFDAKTTEALATILEQNPKTLGEIPVALQTAWEQFSKITLELRRTGSVSLPNGIILRNNVQMEMGFLESCRNYTTGLSERIVLDLSQLSEAISTEVRSHVESREGVHFYGAGAAAGAKYSRKDIPREPPLKGSKDPDPTTQGTGVRPDVGSGRPQLNAGQPGTGGESGAGDLQEE